MKQLKQQKKDEKQSGKTTGISFENLIENFSVGLDKTKNKYISDKCTEIEQSSRVFKPKEMFKMILDITKEFKPKVGNIKDKRGRILTSRTSIINISEEYIRELHKKETYK